MYIDYQLIDGIIIISLVICLFFAMLTVRFQKKHIKILKKKLKSNVDINNIKVMNPETLK